MILRIRLENWRAYDRLDLELGPGATFVVASNGIGKTSLVMAAAWGIFGDASGVKASEEIRGEAERAVVTLDLRTPTAGSVQITRTVDRRGRSTVEVTAGEWTLDGQDALDELLVAEFGAESRVLAQLTFMIHGGLHETQGEFELRDHLAGLFGVRPLFEAAARADALAAESAASVRRTKLVDRKDQRDRDELKDELETAERELAAAADERRRAVETLNAASERLRAATDWSNYRRAVRERDTKLAAYAASASAMLDGDVEPESVLEALTRIEDEESAVLSEAETAGATAKGKLELVRESLALLESSGGTCPTCLRPFAEHDAEQAAREHGRHLESLEAAIAEAEERAAAQRAVLTNLRRVLADIRSLPVPVEPSSPQPPSDVESIRVEHDAIRDDVQRRDRDIAVRTASAQALRAALDDIERDRAQAWNLEELFRLEGLATAAAQTFRQTATEITEHHIEPLVAEVARRWKQTFGREGLQLSADGRITRRLGARTLEFGALSGGERVWALLVVRLLIASASLRAPFVWLDEPLEHLDPKLRRIVAGTLAMASAGEGIRQVIVTTYEAPIAQQLMEDVPSASLIYVAAAD